MITNEIRVKFMDNVNHAHYFIQFRNSDGEIERIYSNDVGYLTRISTRKLWNKYSYNICYNTPAQFITQSGSINRG